MVGEGTLERWMALEMSSLQKGFVGAARPLPDLLAEERPSARTRGGEPHEFDKEVLLRLHAALGPLDRRRLRLPVTFFVDKDLQEDAYVQDQTAANLLCALGEVPPGIEMREGRLWLSRAKAHAVADRYRSAFQFAFH